MSTEYTVTIHLINILNSVQDKEINKTNECVVTKLYQPEIKYQNKMLSNCTVSKYSYIYIHTNPSVIQINKPMLQCTKPPMNSYQRQGQ